ncbi:MAG TPA: CcmD family protein [Acidobacteriota bacterium]|jgi:CcmD family protein
MNFYLFTAYTLIWTVLFVYIVALHRKQNATESKLKERAEKRHAG